MKPKAKPPAKKPAPKVSAKRQRDNRAAKIGQSLIGKMTAGQPC